jgi:hypothetical protein
MPATLSRTQGYPKITMRPDQGLEIEDRVYAVQATYAGFIALLPDIGDTMSDIETTAKLIKYGKIERDLTDTHWYCDLTYATPSTAYVFSIEQSPMERPVEFKTAASGGNAFLMKWKYHLAGFDVTAATPGWYSTATTPVIASPDEQTWRWVNDNAEVPTEIDGTRWGIKASRTKPGVESFIVGSVIVRAAGWYTTFEDAETAAALLAGIVGKRVVPSETFGYGGAAENWLCVGLDVQPDGYYWTIALRYQYSAEGWDSDLYADFAS